ncbi:MAG TPA: efflux RND transporter periplasmic adaptor subunit [Gemmatimonadaceae bacterium]
MKSREEKTVPACVGDTRIPCRRHLTTRSVFLAVAVAGAAACRGEQSAAPPLPLVELATAVVDGSGEDIVLSGTIEAERTTPLDFGVIGTIEELAVHEGQVVQRGQVLGRLKTRAYEDALAIAVAKADQAEDALRRLEPMHRNRTIADVKWVEVQTGVQQARHARSLAQKNLDDCVLRAPVDGTVTSRSAEPGMTTMPGRPVLVLVSTRVVRATAPVPSGKVARLRMGQVVSVLVDAVGTERSGEIVEIGVVADPLTRTYPVKVRLPNTDGALRVGMVAKLRVRIAGAASAVVVPREAVRVDGSGEPVVYVVRGDVVRYQPVEVAGYRGEYIAISRGLFAGDRVVTSGTPMLADGIKIRVAATPDSGARAR